MKTTKQQIRLLKQEHKLAMQLIESVDGLFGKQWKCGGALLSESPQWKRFIVAVAKTERRLEK